MTEGSVSTMMVKSFQENLVRKGSLAKVVSLRLRSSSARSRTHPEQSGTKQLPVGNEAIELVDIERQTSTRETDCTSESTTTSSDASKSNSRSQETRATKARAPEQAITLFAFRLALLEKAACSAGALTFVWATVVLLGGFSSLVSSTDFLVVTILLLTEGSRIFLLANELEWQQASSRVSVSLIELISSLARKSNRAVTGIFHPCPRSLSAAVLPVFIMVSTQSVSARGMATISYIGEVISALLCSALSIWRLIEHDFQDRDTIDYTSDVSKNVVRSLYAFYVMALLEAFIFLVEKCYWEYKICHEIIFEQVYEKLFERVDEKAKLKEGCVDTIRSFFYKVYSCSLTISVFKGLEMDLVSYSMELLQSDDAKEVLGGSRILRTFVEHYSEDDTLRRIGMKSVAIDRLVELLAWHHDDEKDIRLNSAAIVMALVSNTRNRSRVIAVSGSLENIMCLIQLCEEVDGPLHAEGSITAQPSQRDTTIRGYGLNILTSLAQDHANCRRIGETRGLLAKLVDIINIRRQGTGTKGYSRTILQSLVLLDVLASTTGTSGSILRPAIVNVVSAIPHLRDILHCEATELSKELHETAVDVLKHLALDKHSGEVIGSTGGVISNLMLLFTRRSLHQMPYQQRYGSGDDASVTEEGEVRLARKAGKVLVRLALQSMENCNRILRLRFIVPRLRILQDKDDELCILAAGILRELFTHMSASMQAEVSQQSEFLLKRAIACDSTRVREAALGLAKALRCLSDEEFAALFQRVDRSELVGCLMECLSHAPSSTKRPKIRRYALELILILLNRDEEFKKAFCTNKKLQSKLDAMLDNISDVENYLLFSGKMGLTRHEEDMESLVLKVSVLCNVDDR